jgi:hypothetical protein
MKMRVLASTVAGASVIFMLGYAIWGGLFVSLMKEGVIQHAGLTKETPNFVALFSSNLLLAFLVAFTFECWSKTRTFVGGLRNGAIIMFIISLSEDLSFMGYMNLYEGFMPIVVDVLAETVRVSLAGGVIGATLGWMTRSAEPARS